MFRSKRSRYHSCESLDSSERLDISEPTPSECDETRAQKKKRSKSIGPSKKKKLGDGLKKFLISTKSNDQLDFLDMPLPDMPEQDLDINEGKAMSTPVPKRPEKENDVGGDKLPRAQSWTKSKTTKSMDTGFDALEYLRNLPLDSLTTIIRSIGADDSKCYGRQDFIRCILVVVQGGVNPNFLEEDASKYRCPICFEVHRQDTKLLECGHYIGESCYRDWGARSKMKGCPLCRKSICFENSEDLTSTLQDLKFKKCPFHFECNWTGAWKDLDEHAVKESDSLQVVTRSWRKTPKRRKSRRKGKSAVFSKRNRS